MSDRTESINSLVGNCPDCGEELADRDEPCAHCLASALAKLRHKKNPPTKEFMRSIIKKRWNKEKSKNP